MKDTNEQYLGAFSDMAFFPTQHFTASIVNLKESAVLESKRAQLHNQYRSIDLPSPYKTTEEYCDIIFPAPYEISPLGIEFSSATIRIVGYIPKELAKAHKLTVNQEVDVTVALYLKSGNKGMSHPIVLAIK